MSCVCVFVSFAHAVSLYRSLSQNVLSGTIPTEVRRTQRVSFQPTHIVDWTHASTRCSVRVRCRAAHIVSNCRDLSKNDLSGTIPTEVRAHTAYAVYTRPMQVGLLPVKHVYYMCVINSVRWQHWLTAFPCRNFSSNVLTGIIPTEVRLSRARAYKSLSCCASHLPVFADDSFQV